jgi:hypothetical protein
MESWLEFLLMSGGLLLFALLMLLGDRAADRRLRRQREAEDAAHRAAE